MAACDFANPRAAARRARLLGPRGAIDLASHPEEEGAALARTPFAAAIAAAEERGLDAADAVDEALRAACADAANDAARFLEGRARALFLDVLLLDAAAELKALLRAAGTGGGGAALALPLPALREEAIRAIAAAPVEAAPEILARAGSPLAPRLAAALAARGAEAGLLHLEAALDREVVAEAVASVRRALGVDAAVARRAIGRHADRANARVLLALGDAPVPPELLVPAGALAGELDALAKLPFADRAARLARRLGTRRHPLHAEDLADPARADVALAAQGERALAGEARAEPLSIAVPLAWVAAVRGEARRLRLVLRGNGFGVPAAELLELVEA